MAFSVQLERVNFSIAFDCITIYPTNMPDAETQNRVVLSQIFGSPKTSIPSDISLKIRQSTEFERNILQNDDDHPLHHHDTFERDSNHYHCKMKGFIKPEILSSILQFFQDKNIISTAEKQFVEKNYHEFLQHDVSVLLAELTRDRACKQTSKEKILGFIQACQYNSKLVILHESLMSDAFSYLREHGRSRWRTINHNQSGIITTSKTWATIEHWITLALYRNLMILCHRFPETLASQYATQINQEFPFTFVDRKVLIYSNPRNQEYLLFEKANRDKLREKAVEAQLPFEISVITRPPVSTPETWERDLDVTDHDVKYKLFNTQEDAEYERKLIGESFPEHSQYLRIDEIPSIKDARVMSYYLIFDKPPESELRTHHRK